MLWLLIYVALTLKACRSQITGFGNTTANYGGQAHYKCEFANPTGVLQVTWQRLFRDGSIQNLATSSKRFGPQVNEPYVEKVMFTDTSLSSTSITLVNVTWGDESCYICYFNVFPNGSQRKQTCLTVQGISEVKTSAQLLSREPEKEEQEIVFSCSATGKPAPTVRWDISPGYSSHQTSAASVENEDHTFTSINNITVTAPLDWRGHADCVLNHGVMGERRERIPFTSHAEDGTNHRTGSSRARTAFIILSVMSALCVAVAAAAIRHKRIKSKRGQCARTVV